jgi:hypothetical protein
VKLERTHLGYSCLEDLIEATRPSRKFKSQPSTEDRFGMLTPRIISSWYDNANTYRLGMIALQIISSWYNNILDLPHPCYGAVIFRDLLVLLERTCLGYYHLVSLSEHATVVLE